MITSKFLRLGDRRLPAFSLIEVAIVLMILGIIAGMGLPALGNMLTTQKHQLTRQRQERVLQALAAYALQHNKLPWPSSDTRGIEDRRAQRGIVPYKTLGISEAEARDGYNHWMTYIPHQQLTMEPDGEAHKGMCCGANPAALQIRNGQGEALFDADVAVRDFPAVVLISHGPAGHGARLGKPAQSPDEQTNSAADGDAVIDRPASTDPQNPFSHTVRWVTRNNFMSIYAHSPCKPDVNQ